MRAYAIITPFFGLFIRFVRTSRFSNVVLHHCCLASPFPECRNRRGFRAKELYLRLSILSIFRSLIAATSYWWLRYLDNSITVLAVVTSFRPAD
ncbi:hypothetical protein F5B17DRAFT_391538 [Nemania serpens]|nr:hypothetical protein F5B17DRAFT_391538 [Nemania serpens]